MKVTAIHTGRATIGGPTLTELLDQYLPELPDNCVVAISSKVAAICEGSVVGRDTVSYQALVKREADYYRTPDRNPARYTLTIKSGVLATAAGIDSAAGHYILWPRDPQSTANSVRAHLEGKHKRKIGVIITDSRSTPMRRGTIGLGLSHSGFEGLTNYVGKPDVFGDRIYLKVANVLDGLAAAAVAVMGEGSQQTPFVIISDSDFIKFQKRNPTSKELEEIRVPLKDDLYAEAFSRMPWDKEPAGDL